MVQSSEASAQPIPVFFSQPTPSNVYSFSVLASRSKEGSGLAGRGLGNSLHQLNKVIQQL